MNEFCYGCSRGWTLHGATHESSDGSTVACTKQSRLRNDTPMVLYEEFSGTHSYSGTKQQKMGSKVLPDRG
jgi:hypothetical protein